MTGLLAAQTADLTTSVGRHAVIPEVTLLALLIGALTLTSVSRLRGRPLRRVVASTVRLGVGLGLTAFALVVAVRFHAYA